MYLFGDPGKHEKHETMRKLFWLDKKITLALSFSSEK